MEYPLINKNKTTVVTLDLTTNQDVHAIGTDNSFQSKMIDRIWICRKGGKTLNKKTVVSDATGLMPMTR